MLNNSELGRLIGVTFSMASRLRSGDRTPGIETMQRIASVLDFPIERQVQAREDGNYAHTFNLAVDAYEAAHRPVDETAAAS